jgi:hypothetical protein
MKPEPQVFFLRLRLTVACQGRGHIHIHVATNNVELMLWVGGFLYELVDVISWQIGQLMSKVTTCRSQYSFGIINTKVKIQLNIDQRYLKWVGGWSNNVDSMLFVVTWIRTWVTWPLKETMSTTMHLFTFYLESDGMSTNNDYKHFFGALSLQFC